MPLVPQTSVHGLYLSQAASVDRGVAFVELLSALVVRLRSSTSQFRSVAPIRLCDQRCDEKHIRPLLNVLAHPLSEMTAREHVTG
jgi:hypothetical protein